MFHAVDFILWFTIAHPCVLSHPRGKNCLLVLC